MFSYIDIAFFKDDIAFSTSGAEYDILNTKDIDSLLVFQVLKQLKISTIQYAFTIINDECFVLRKIDPELELIDSTLRFEYNRKKALNKNDLFLFNQFLEISNLNKNHALVWVKWGRKIEYYFDIVNDKNKSIEFKDWYQVYGSDVKDLVVMKQRFKILLNEPFLNKLKTYIQLWKLKYNMSYELPEWYNQLYKLK